jgi:general nucleoside transport system ATP-binding protein
MPHIELVDITKRFGAVAANDGVSIDFREGEIHALLGENGAGKTTLMNILYGLYRPDSGRVLIDGVPVGIHSPQQAIAHGIGMVHQHFMLVPSLTVAENYAIGQTPILSRLSMRAIERKVVADSERVGLALDPRSLVADLSVGRQQRVEIVRALGRGARLLILDEPTAVLTPQEAGELMAACKEMAARGTTIVFISHKLEEVMGISDRISILRNGKHVRTVTPAQTSKRELALMMIGRDELATPKSDRTPPGPVMLSVRNLTVHDDRNHPAVKDVSFDLHRHEILGIAGVDGNGQSELTQALVGLRAASAGSVRLDGQELVARSPAEIIRAGVGSVSEDRQVWGLFPDLSIAENLIADRHAWPPFCRDGLLRRQVIAETAQEIVRSFDIRPPEPRLRVGALSGGNKQKVVIARAFAREPRVLVISQPTRGVDVGATAYIRQRVLDERARGAAILLVSADLDEVMALSDRIAVMYEGRFAAILSAAEATVERLGLLMAGVGRAEAAA